eukprot:gene3062-1346_t
MAPKPVPLPAIVFISVLLGCIVILCIIYQLLKRGKCCQVHGAEVGDEEEQEELITNEEGGKESIKKNTKDTASEQDSGLPNVGAVIASSSALGAAFVGVTVEPAAGPSGETQSPGLAAASSTLIDATGNTSIDLTVSDGSFPLVHLLPVEDEPVSNCGKVLLETTFSPVANKMIISVVRAADVPGVDRGGTAMVEVHIAILPNKRWKFRTRARPSNSPVFNERYTLYPVTLKLLEDMSIRVRLYGRKKLGKKVLGELEVPMTDIDLHGDLCDEPMWKTLLPFGMVEPPIRPQSSASKGSSIVKGDPPELQISLHYKSMTGRLEVGVLKGRSLTGILSSPKQACYVHLLFLGPEDFATQGTTKRKKGPEPEFEETFIFTMGHDEIPEVALTLSLKTGNTVIGWFSLGRNYSGTREERTWKALYENSDVTLRQWLRLLSAS